MPRKTEESTFNLKREVRKLRAVRVAEYQLQQRLDRIDWEEDVLKPELETLGQQIVEGRVLRITIDDQSK